MASVKEVIVADFKKKFPAFGVTHAPNNITIAYLQINSVQMNYINDVCKSNEWTYTIRPSQISPCILIVIDALNQ